MKFKVFTLFIAFILSTCFTVNNAYAEAALVELQAMTDNCNKYAKKVYKNSITEKYTEFDEKKHNFQNKEGFKYLDPNTVKDNNGNLQKVRIYELDTKNVDEIYEKVLQIVNNRQKKTYSLRKTLPEKSAEDIVKQTESVKQENAGFTCYIQKSPREFWIKTEPYKNKKAVFIIDGNTGKLYYRENILPNDN